jgi:hypothetical protein
MVAVYKSLVKINGNKPENGKEVKKNKQRVLILSSRGVTYRYVVLFEQDPVCNTEFPPLATDISSMISTPSFLIAGKTQNSTPRPNYINLTS